MATLRCPKCNKIFYKQDILKYTEGFDDDYEFPNYYIKNHASCPSCDCDFLFVERYNLQEYLDVHERE